MELPKLGTKPLYTTYLLCHIDTTGEIMTSTVHKIRQSMTTALVKNKEQGTA